MGKWFRSMLPIVTRIQSSAFPVWAISVRVRALAEVLAIPCGGRW